MNLIHPPYFVAVDIDRCLLLQLMDIGIDTMERIDRREDINALQEIESEEQKKNTQGRQYTYLDFTNILHLIIKLGT